VKAMLLRVGIDKGTDGALAPIFDDESFEYIPISEGDPHSEEDRTYANSVGRGGKSLSTYLPERIKHRKMHFDPEFETSTYGDPTSKRKYLLKLQKGDMLVFYAGLTPFRNKRHREGLYIIGYFTVDKVIDFNRLSESEIERCRKIYRNNAHLKRSWETELDLVIVVGDKSKSELLDKAVPISKTKLDKRGRPYQCVSSETEKLLGISGSIQRSIPPRFIENEKAISNLEQMLGPR